MTPPNWRGAAEQLSERLAGREVVFAPLGVRDELAAPANPYPAGTIVVHVYGETAILGPFPVDAACRRCLARRWQAIRPTPVRGALETGGSTVVGEQPGMTSFALDVMTAVVQSALAEPPTSPEVWRLDLTTLAVRRFPLLADTGCPECGQRASVPMQLGPAPKPREGSFRQREVHEYELPLAALANPVCGMLGPGIALSHGSTTTAAAVGQFAVRNDHDLYEIFWAGHTDSYDLSVRIGLLEGLERYAGTRGPAEAVTASLRQLRSDGRRAVDPADCGLYSKEFHQANPHIAPFTVDREIRWVHGHSLTADEPVLVPEVLAYFYSGDQRERFVQGTSSGCASGSSLTEAVYFGLMELVERDAFLLAWYSKTPLPEIDPDSVRSPQARRVMDRLALCGYRTRLFDGRSTFPFPVVIAAAVREDGGPGALCFGAGASLDPESALRAGLAEIATDAPALSARTRAELPRLQAMAADFDQVHTVHDHTLLYGLPEMADHTSFLFDSEPSCTMADLVAEAPLVTDDLWADLRWCVDVLAGQHLEVVAVEQTLPQQRELGLHTASVLVPGLLPIDFGWQRQRAPRMPRLLATGPPHLVPHPFP